MKEISIEDVGPIRSLRIPLPDEGGIVCLVGRNGIGKSVALGATQVLIGGDEKLEARRGSLGSGQVDGLGAKITVGKRVRRTGTELEVETLSSDFDLSQIVDPGVADPVRADAVRIKALVAASGIRPDRAEYVKVLGDSELFDDIGTGVSLNDPITATAILKRNAEAKAREFEKTIEQTRGEIQSLETANSGIDLAAESDEQVLASRYETAVQQLAEAEQQVRNAAIVRANAVKAREQLATTEAAPAVSVDEATFKVGVLKETLGRLESEGKALAAKLELIRRDFAVQQANLKAAEQAVESAMTRDKVLTEWRATIAESESVECPTETFLQTLRDEKVRRQLLQQEGVRVREAKKRVEMIAAKCRELLTDQSCAETMRQAAANVETVLTEAVQRAGVAGLGVKDGRMVFQKGDEIVYFSELSDGERWHIALDVGISRVGENGLLVIPQYAFSEIDPVNRKLIDAHARANRAVVLTAEATADEELHAELLNAI